MKKKVNKLLQGNHLKMEFWRQQSDQNYHYELVTQYPDRIVRSLISIALTPKH